MRLYALLALLVLHAHAASINNKPEKRTDDLDNIDLDDVSELDKTISKNAAAIPVLVLEDAAKKVDVNSNDYVPDNDESSNIKRVEIDLKNPGPPQRQEHETQNPENYGDIDKAIVAVKLKIAETKNVFNEEYKGVSQTFHTLFTQKEDLPKMLESLKNFRTVFSSQIEELGKSIKTNLIPNSIDAKSEIEGPIPLTDAITSNLKLVERRFETGINTLNEGVELLSIIREEDDAEKAKEEAEKAKQVKSPIEAKDDAASPEATSPPAPEATSPPSPGVTTESSTNPVSTFFNNFYQSMTNAFSNLNTSVQNYYNPESSSSTTGAPGTVTTAPSTGGIGNLFQGISFPNIFQNQGQVQQNEVVQGAQSDDPAPQQPNIFQQIQTQIQNGPIGQAIQGFTQFLRPDAAAAGTTPQNNAPPAAGQAQPTTNNQNPPQAQTQTGPIQTIIQNNPIVKGIQQAVQRLQNNPIPNAEKEKPREPVAVKKDALLKGHGGYGGYYGVNNYNNHGDNNNSNRIKSDEPEIVESLSDIVKDSEPEEAILDAISPPAISEKTD